MFYSIKQSAFSQIEGYPGISIRWFSHVSGWAPFFKFFRSMQVKRQRSWCRHLPSIQISVLDDHEADRWVLLGIRLNRRKLIAIEFPTPAECLGHSWIEKHLRWALGLDPIKVASGD